MGKSNNWYGMGVALFIIALVHLAFFHHRDHTDYAMMEAIWGVACFVLGLRADLKK